MARTPKANNYAFFNCDLNFLKLKNRPVLQWVDFFNLWSFNSNLENTVWREQDKTDPVSVTVL